MTTTPCYIVNVISIVAIVSEGKYSKCGIENKEYKSGNVNRIVGGMQASPHRFPWQALVQDEQGRICGGSVISNRHIITAAHCIERMKK